MIKQIWPVCLIVVEKFVYCMDVSMGTPNIKWYEGSVEIKLNPRVNINIDRFFVELNIDNKIEEVGLSYPFEDRYGITQDENVGSGYSLERGKSIGPKKFDFKFMVKNREIVNKKALIVLKVGSRQRNWWPLKRIEKQITLEEENNFDDKT